MEIVTVVRPDAESASQVVADRFITLVKANPRATLGLATGGTPVETYRLLVEAYQAGTVNFEDVQTFNLDEYIGLAADHPQSFRYFMQQQFFDHVNVDPKRTHVPNGVADNVDSTCAEYEALIRDGGGIDLQLLGIGHNGHIAFNEPGSLLESRTRMVSLTDETIENNARFFDSREEVPRHAITMGIQTILEAREIILLALGEAKSEAVDKLLYGPVTDAHPASALQNHKRVTVVLDAVCASGIKQLADSL
ncbi:MAG: glucosamine-6-phosphate deaminase [Planctomycetota bacterium]